MKKELQTRKQRICKSKTAILNTRSSIFSKLNGKCFEVLYTLGSTGVTLNINGVHTDFHLKEVLAA